MNGAYGPWRTDEPMAQLLAVRQNTVREVHQCLVAQGLGAAMASKPAARPALLNGHQVLISELCGVLISEMFGTYRPTASCLGCNGKRLFARFRAWCISPRRYD